MNKKKTTTIKKKKTKSTEDEIPIMTTASYVKETNHLVWEIRNKIDTIHGQYQDAIEKLWSVCLNCYGYGDDLRNACFRFVKEPQKRENKNELIRMVGEIHKLHDQLSSLEFALRRDGLIDAHERETNKNHN